MRRLSRALLAPMAVALLFCYVVAEDCDCTMEKDFVCGDDGFTYQNGCLAKCQGVNVARTGSCDEGRKKSGGITPAALLASKHLVTEGTVTAQAMTRFSSEGFKFIATMKLVDGKSMTQPTIKSGDNKRSNKPNGVAFATRMTSEGHLYIQPEAAAKAAMAKVTGPKEIPAVKPPKGPKGNSTSRKLLVWGWDGRVQQTTRQWPHSAVGHVTFSGPQGGGYICSGALVGPSTVFTAGHCVFDAGRNAWNRDLDFWPGRLSQSSTNGAYRWSWVTTWWNNAVGQCNTAGGCNLDAFKYDIAVVRLPQAVGNWNGWLGFAYECTNKGYSVTSAGYPGDKPYGTQWRTSGWLNNFNGCDSAIWDGVNGVVASDLDVYGGQSGSNVWDSGFYTRALVNAMGWDGRAYHRTMTRSVFNWVLSVRV